MSKPVRVQLSRRKGWKMPPNTVKVDRSTKWGNPYRAGVHCDHQHAVDCHRFLMTQGGPAKSAPWPDTPPMNYALTVAKDIAELRGKNLACWCHLCDAHKNGKPFGVECADCAPCHSDCLGELANVA